MENNFWNRKLVFLTGASSGIGEGLAVALAKRGATLGLLARREELLKKLAAECERSGGTARIFPCDILKIEKHFRKEVPLS